MLERDTSGEGQRVHVAVLFSDLCDYSSYSELTDPEEVDSLKRSLEELAARVVSKHHGVITQLYGDGILAVFGLPVPAEDDARRAIEAALELHERVRQLIVDDSGFEVRMHSGVHAGLVFARAGDALHGQYEVTGDAVNTASRLASVAARDQVVVSGDAMRGAEAFFVSEPSMELQLKGKRSPVLAYLVRSRSGVQTRFEARMQAGLTPYVGRTRELDSLLRELAEARKGQGRLALLSGAPGIGKTRLLEELRTRAADSGMLVLSGSCDSYGEMPALEPFLQALRQIFGIQRSGSTAEAAAVVENRLAEYELDAHKDVILSLLALRGASSGVVSVPIALATTFRAMGPLIERLCEETAIALLLDDWQWADPLSKQVLLRITRFVAKRPVCIVVGMRESTPIDPRLHATLTLNLEPFSIEESRQVISRLRAHDLDVGLTSALHERSGGNPLYLEELVGSLSEDLRGEQSLARLHIPNTLQGLIQARTARLPADPKRLLQRASVIGLEFSEALLADASDSVPLQSALAQLLEEGLILPVAERNAFRFKHGITREIVYGSVRIAERRRIHHEVANALEQKVAARELMEQSEALAFHFQGSGDHERAATYAEQAGDKAAASSFIDAARRHYEAARLALDQLPLDAAGKRRWLRVVSKWAGQCAYAPSRPQLAVLERAEAIACEIRDDRARAHNSHMLGWLHYVFGNYTESLEHARRAFTLAEKVQDHRLLVQLWTSLGQVYSVSGQYELAREHLDRGIELKRDRAAGTGPRSSRPPTGGPAVLYAHALTCRAMVNADIGDFRLADRDLQEALSIVAGTSHAMEPSVLSHHSIVLARQGHWARCFDAAKHACRLAARLNSDFVFGISSAMASYAQWRVDASSEALTQLRNAVDWLESHQFGLYISFAYGCLAEAFEETAQLELARDYAQRALERVARGDPQGAVAAHRVLARLAARRRDPAEGERQLQAARELARTRNLRRELALTALCSAELAQPAAADSVQTLVQSFTELDMPWYAERAARLARAAQK